MGIRYMCRVRMILAFGGFLIFTCCLRIMFDLNERYVIGTYIVIPPNKEVLSKFAPGTSSTTSSSTTTTTSTVKPPRKGNKKNISYRKDIENLKNRIATLENGTVKRAPLCEKTPSDLVGHMRITLNDTTSFQQHVQFNDIQPGGTWKPSTCVARQRTAIIIPFRDRDNHLEKLLYYLIPVLKRQQIDFRIFVIEQYGNKTYNKGRLMNTGFIEAWTKGDFDCFVFHDVDLIPENDKNMYTCEKYPRHMSSAVDKFKYKLPYTLLVGGVFSIRPDLYMKVNGYSNLYWGWGGEDDDMAFRLKDSKLGILRPPSPIGRFKMIRHPGREKSPAKVRFYLLKTVKKRYKKDGLNTLDYRIIFTQNSKLFTHVMVDIGDPPKDINKLTNFMV